MNNIRNAWIDIKNGWLDFNSSYDNWLYLFFNEYNYEVTSNFFDCLGWWHYTKHDKFGWFYED